MTTWQTRKFATVNLNLFFVGNVKPLYAPTETADDELIPETRMVLCLVIFGVATTRS